MKSLEFGWESDGQPFLRVRHEADRNGWCGASKIEFESMRLFQAFPSEYIEKFIEQAWASPGNGEFIAADEEFYKRLAALEKQQAKVAA